MLDREVNSYTSSGTSSFVFPNSESCVLPTPPDNLLITYKFYRDTKEIDYHWRKAQGSEATTDLQATNLTRRHSFPASFSWLQSKLWSVLPERERELLQVRLRTAGRRLVAAWARSSRWLPAHKGGASQGHEVHLAGAALTHGGEKDLKKQQQKNVWFGWNKRYDTKK